MKSIIRYIFFLSFLLVALQVYADSRVLRSLTASDGLTDLTVNALYKDSLGFVWIGTGNSVVRFDGVFLKHYGLTGADERLKRVNILVATSDYHIWMGNGLGLWRLNWQSDAFEQVVPDIINCAVLSLLDDGNGTLYIGSEHGLYIHRNGRFEHFLLDSNSFSEANAVTAMTLDGKGSLWLATSKGLYAMNLQNNKFSQWHNETENGHYCMFNQIARVGSKLYLGTMDRGIVCFDTSSKTFSPFISVGCNVISSLSSDGKQMLYVGTDGNGVHFIDTEHQKETFSMRHEAGNDSSLRSNSVYSLLVDKEGIVWVGFYQSGLDYTLYQGDTFTVYSFPPYFHSKDIPIRSVSINGGEKLIGSRNGLFYINEDKGHYREFDVPDMRSSMIFCIHRFEGKYFIGTYGGGMYMFDSSTLELNDFSSEEPFQKGHIFCMKEDAEGMLWIGTSMGVFCYRDGKILAHYTSSNSKLPEGNVYEIFFDSTRKGWICTENGLCIWDPSSKKLRTDIFPEGFIHKEKIRVIYEDSDHQLYFFPDKGTLFLSDLSMNSFRRLQPGTPLEGRDGMFIIEDRRKGLWMGTSNGLFYYDRKDNFVLYNFVDGIPGSTFTLCPPVCDEAGNFWFGNSRGLLFLDVKRIGEKAGAAYPVRITDVLVNGKRPLVQVDRQSNSGEEVLLEPSEKNVTFRMSDFSYTSPSVMAYEYMLDGRDEGWQTLSGKSEVTYYNLPSGSYVFRVRRMGQPGSEAALKVDIASDFHAWMAWGIVLVVFFLGGSYYFRRQKRPAVQPVLLEETALSQQKAVRENKPVVEEKYKTVKVSSEECKRLAEKLEDVMRREKPYIHPDLKIADLATAIGTSAHTLSYLFNQYLERNYYDYINDYRISEFKRLVNTDEYARYTLSALAELCGFSSRASFFRYFKKATGITPNEYIRSIGKNNE